MRILVTAGPTREMIDAVRFLSNLSSGRTGYAIAGAARDLGHAVTLISGPVALPRPSGLDFVPVVSAADMHRAVRDAFDEVDAVIMSAAVADYRPARVTEGKMKKTTGPLSLELERTTDILRELGGHKTRQILVGFALEVQDAEDNARRKFEEKNLDLLVLNSPGNFGTRRSRFRLLSQSGWEEAREADKNALGHILLERLQALYDRRST